MAWPQDLADADWFPGGAAAPGGALLDRDGGMEQAIRLARFREAHPEVIIGDGEFGTVQARIPQPDGEIVTSRHTMAELLDKLDVLVRPAPG